MCHFPQPFLMPGQREIGTGNCSNPGRNGLLTSYHVTIICRVAFHGNGGHPCRHSGHVLKITRLASFALWGAGRRGPNALRRREHMNGPILRGLLTKGEELLNADECCSGRLGHVIWIADDGNAWTPGIHHQLFDLAPRRLTHVSSGRNPSASGCPVGLRITGAGESSLLRREDRGGGSELLRGPSAYGDRRATFLFHVYLLTNGLPWRQAAPPDGL